MFIKMCALTGGAAVGFYLDMCSFPVYGPTDWI